MPPGRAPGRTARGPAGEVLLAVLERDSLLYQLTDRRTLELGRLEHAFSDRLLGGVDERLVGRLEHLEGVGLGVAGRVHDVLQVHRPRDAGALQHRWITRRRDGDR